MPYSHNTHTVKGVDLSPAASVHTRNALLLWARVQAQSERSEVVVAKLVVLNDEYLRAKQGVKDG
jgi:hypothetical protein